MIRQILGAGLTALICCTVSPSQTTDPRPTFEAVSIKPAPPFDITYRTDYRDRGGPGTNDPGQVTYPMTNVFALLLRAYGVKPDQIIGPASLTAANYYVVAKIPPNTSKDQFNSMLRNMLADRFHLALHRETRSFPAYALVIAKGGPKIAPSPPEADAPPSEQELFPGKMQIGQDDFPVLRPGGSQTTAYYDGIARGTFRITMAEFAEFLGPYVRIPTGSVGYSALGATPRITDRTGLTDKYDFKFEFAMAPQSQRPQLNGESEEPQSTLESPFHAPNILTALEKQLGLKLEKGAKVDLDVLVVDHVDKVPTEN